MKKLNLSLLAVLIAAAVMPQSVFSMIPQQHTGQPQDTAQFIYFNGGTHRKVIATGNMQMRIGTQWNLADGTTSNNYQWIDITRPEQPSDIMNLGSSGENNNNFE